MTLATTRRIGAEKRVDGFERDERDGPGSILGNWEPEPEDQREAASGTGISKRALPGSLSVTVTFHP